MEEESEFFNDLSSLCAKALVKARKAGPECQADVVSALAEMLGKSVAVACHGDASAISKMLDGLDLFVAEQATGHAQLFDLLSSKGLR